MDPSQAQEDKTNNSHSLESGDNAADASPQAAPTTGQDQVTDATGGRQPDPTEHHQKPHQSLPSRIWHKFDIYLMLFVLVVVLAIGIVVAMTVKSKQTAQNNINQQGLSQTALQQLANSDVTVGDARQVLTVQSNAVFAGSVLVRSNLEVAGTLKVGGAVNFSSLQVSGQTQLSETQVTNLTVSGALNLQGALTIKNGINVSGNSNFAGNITASSVTTGSLQINGDLNLTHHIAAGGTIPSASRGTAVGGGGTVSLSGSDTAGSITINTGNSPPAGCFVSVTFSQKFSSTPHIVITPIGSAAAGLDYYLDRSTTDFKICTTSPAPSGQSFGFDYIAVD
ncbi:MAG TPA: hypothetical protein VMR45_02425 [Patescibacteria group bacterium]|jgi:cytoskeletal protein CcmA (bactofilin family)|nr:hypothetical protein [Patescibacteria group bacterium]